MTEQFSADNGERERETPLDRVRIVERLKVLGVDDVELEDFEDQDDNDVLGTLANLALMYDLELDDLLMDPEVGVTDIEAPIDRKHIAETLAAAGVHSLDEATLDTLPDEALPRMIAWHAKEIGIVGEPLEELGYRCLDEKWEKGRWI